MSGSRVAGASAVASLALLPDHRGSFAAFRRLSPRFFAVLCVKAAEIDGLRAQLAAAAQMATSQHQQLLAALLPPAATAW